MSLSLNTPATPLPAIRPRADASRTQYIELKANVHRKLLNRLNLEALASVERSRAESEIRTLLFDLIAEEGMPLSMTERDAILGDVIDEVFGLGPLEPLLRDPTVSDILVNTYKQVYVERSGRLERLPTTFQDDKHLMRVIDRIVSGVGRRVDDSLADGRRAAAGRVARQRDHSAARGRRAAPVDSPLSGRAPESRGPAADPLADAPDARVPRALRAVAAEHADQRRHGLRQDDAARTCSRASFRIASGS